MAEQRKLITDVLNTFFSKNTIAIGNNKPTTGTHVPGDIVIKSNPVADEAIGWICTAAGSPGTWVEFGANNGKLATARKITIGNSSKSFDGSSDISWSLSEIGAAASSSALSLGTTSTTAYRGDYGNTAYTHSQAAHAPSNAQKNSDITKAEIEAKLKGTITSHTHSYLPLSGGTLTGDLTMTSGKTIRLSSTEDYTNARVGVDANTGDVYISNINSNWFRIKPDKTLSIGGSKVYTAIDKPTPEEIGAAPASHGTHLDLGTTSTTAYRGDYGNTAYTHSQAAHAPSNAQKNSDITKAEIEAKLKGTITSHTHNYAGSSSAGGAANSVKTNLAIKLNGGTTEGTDLFTFNGSTAKTINITPSSIGAAAASHGTHLTLGTSSSNAYRGDYGNTAYTHSQAAHAPSNAQKNSDITKAEIEAKLKGTITSHSHDTVAGLSFWYGTQAEYDAISSKSSTTIYMITN